MEPPPSPVPAAFAARHDGILARHGAALSHRHQRWREGLRYPSASLIGAPPRRAASRAEGRGKRGGGGEGGGGLHFTWSGLALARTARLAVPSWLVFFDCIHTVSKINSGKFALALNSSVH